MKEVDIFYKDSCRRDFTINSLAMKYNGDIVDYHGGQEDIKNSVLKFIGNPEERIKEDALRILRFFRFQSKFEVFDKTKIDKPSLDACVKYKNLLDNISVERIHSEFFKILVGNHNKEIIELMFESDIFIPLTSARIDTSHLNRLRMLSGNPLTAYVSLFYNVIKYEPVNVIGFVKNQSDYWKFSNAERNQFESILQLSKMVKTTDDLKKVLSRKTIHKSHILEFAYLEDNNEFIIGVKDWIVPEFPLKGQDLLDSGIKEGKEFGDKIAQLRSLWEDSNFTLTKEDLMTKGGGK